MRRCSKCGKNKYDIDFSPSGTGTLRGDCKQCHSRYVNEARVRDQKERAEREQRQRRKVSK